MIGKVRILEITIRPEILAVYNREPVSIMNIRVLVNDREEFCVTRAFLDDDITPRLEWMFEEAKERLFAAIKGQVQR